ncbi:hypothetical protein BUALT_Bualt16G0029000 [Buddleja alternifolia]|uniref:Transposase-associated domain-containing protein n=1 Tax=Buddleja alternifolia TaxID=168488 RepID=A0AAV6WJ75_9LAMI|nr:hypothetical protein BUALT_Bualt16G0029000 [Buddleja alternifolia]
MDKSWMTLEDRRRPEYENGVQQFLNFAYSSIQPGESIRCPCRKCNNVYFQNRGDVEADLLQYGIIRNYNTWVLHGEELDESDDEEFDFDEEEDDDQVEFDEVNNSNPRGNQNEYADIQSMLEDCYTASTTNSWRGDESLRNENAVPESESDKFMRLLRDADTELYPGCEKFTKLSFVVTLMHLKILSRWSNKSFSMLLEILKKALPNDGEKKRNKIAQKVLRYFPLKPRLQRLFISKKTAEDMRWHKEKCENDGVLRHPADAGEWKEFDKTHESFAQDPRNVRLGLATDGFNPFSNMSLSHSTWPVILLPYNLPPWKCLKAPFFILSMLIPGPTSPGNDIDVFLEPLIDELKDLWDHGVETYDASTGTNFNLRAAILWTIHDFPGYGIISGWSTKGYLYKLKQYVGNKAFPEGSMAEGYIAEECLTFCSMYLNDIETQFSKAERNYERREDRSQQNLSVFCENSRLVGKGIYAYLNEKSCKQVHAYVLKNCDEVLTFISEHKEELKQNGGANVEKRHEESFSKWFEERAQGRSSWNILENKEYECVTIDESCQHNQLDSRVDMEDFLSDTPEWLRNDIPPTAVDSNGVTPIEEQVDTFIDVQDEDEEEDYTLAEYDDEEDEEGNYDENEDDY